LVWLWSPHMAIGFPQSRESKSGPGGCQALYILILSVIHHHFLPQCLLKQGTKSKPYSGRRELSSLSWREVYQWICGHNINLMHHSSLLKDFCFQLLQNAAWASLLTCYIFYLVMLEYWLMHVWSPLWG
jgi:hypothetical protein